MDSPLRTGLALLTVWGLAVVATLGVARFSRVGPVLYTLSHGHGIHEGDVVAAVLFAGFAAVVSVIVVRR